MAKWFVFVLIFGKRDIIAVNPRLLFGKKGDILTRFK
jgi:hypothetical protein